MLLTMANLQRVVISLLLIVTAGFLFLAQTSSAAKGPKITNKVRGLVVSSFLKDHLFSVPGRSTSISRMMMRHLAGS